MHEFLLKTKMSLYKQVPDNYEIITDEVAPYGNGIYKQAAVLIGIIDHNEPTIVLTRRPMHMKKHAGQIAFPGGKVEASDVNAIATAYREANEEIGLDPNYIEFLGYSDIYQIGSGFKICPVVAKIDRKAGFLADPNEVDEIFEIPLDFLMNVKNFKQQHRILGARRHNYAVLEYGNYFIWGATADMLKRLSEKLY